MQGRILIVDAIATNRIVLKVKLAAAFYHVDQAASLAGAVQAAQAHPPDLIISALSLPDGDSAELCRRLSASPLTDAVPMMAIGSTPDADSRMATLAAGVHDVLLKPIDDTLLLGRVRSLIRARNAAVEWQMRDDTSRALGLAEPAQAFGVQGHCVLVSSDRGHLQGWAIQLRPVLRARLSTTTPADIMRAFDSDTMPDVFVLILPGNQGDAATTLRLISALRANAPTRHAGILLVQSVPDPVQASNALDLGADDLMSDGFEPQELGLRLRALLRRTHTAAQLRATVRTGLQAAVFDPLTGLHNRRYALPHLARVAEHARATGRPFAVMVADLDFFKRINDIHGHTAGDAVLVEAARRLRGNLRAVDLVARIGGEEFLIVMPGTPMASARSAAVRLCDAIGSLPFGIPDSVVPITVTISIGMAIGAGASNGSQFPADCGETLMSQADKALYAAKLRGRNQVTLGRPAA